MTAADAAHYFATKLAFETDPSDVHAAFESAEASFVLIDTRSAEAWRQGHARPATHIPRADLASRVPAEYPLGTEFVVYCWGPACNGATRSALELATMGYAVKEMLGGFEYWAREGLPVDGVGGDITRAPDPLTAPVPVGGGRIDCDC
ncbi:MAG: sulfurtransferase [Actinobacteria bacterium HGW-Actinobacteria-4]|nr:MAG: sulfurtransferase [Actinobacteria bacterium HGW-Actinobacteria-4]